MTEFSTLVQKGAILAVRVTPNARRPGLERLEGGQILIRVSAPPEAGRATEAARASLAKALGIALSRLTLIRGATSRDKQFRLD